MPGAEVCDACGIDELLFACDECDGRFCADHRDPGDHAAADGDSSGTFLPALSGSRLGLGAAAATAAASLPSLAEARHGLAIGWIRFRDASERWSRTLAVRGDAGYRWLHVRADEGYRRLRVLGAEGYRWLRVRSERSYHWSLVRGEAGYERLQVLADAGARWLRGGFERCYEWTRPRVERTVDAGRRRSAALTALLSDRLGRAARRVDAELRRSPAVARALDSTGRRLGAARSEIAAAARRLDDAVRGAYGSLTTLVGLTDDGNEAGSGSSAWADGDDGPDGRLPVGRRAIIMFGATATVSAATALQLGQPAEGPADEDVDPFEDLSFGYGGGPLAASGEVGGNASNGIGASSPTESPTPGGTGGTGGSGGAATTAATATATATPTEEPTETTTEPTPTPTERSSNGGGGSGGGGGGGGNSGGGGSSGGGGGGGSSPTPTPTPTPTSTATPTATPTTTTTPTSTPSPTPTPTQTPEDEYGVQGYGQYGYGG